MPAKNSKIEFCESEEVAIDCQANKNAEVESEIVSDSHSKKNEQIGQNLIEPLCGMRQALAECKNALELDKRPWSYREFIEYFERSCDQLWKSLNL